MSLHWSSLHIIITEISISARHNISLCETRSNGVIIIIIIIITFMQGIYNYVPETNQVCRAYNVVAVLYLQFLLLVSLYHT